MTMQTLTSLNFNSEDLKISQYKRPCFHQAQDQSHCSNYSNSEKQKPTWFAARLIVFSTQSHPMLMPPLKKHNKK